MTAVSVVMGTYNDAEILPATLDSVLGQDLTDFEFIVVNDGSSDPRVQEILEDYRSGDPRIKPIQKQNEGLTRALIDGCGIAQGNYIARIDAGDVMLPGRLAAQARVLAAHTDCAFVSCWTEFCGPQWEPLWLAQGAPALDAPTSVLADDPEHGLLADVTHHGAVMFRRSSYVQAGGYRSEFYYGQDWDLWYRLAELGHYYVVPGLLYRARIFPGSISMTRKPLQDESARCSFNAYCARRRGLTETPWLLRAAAACPNEQVGRKTLRNREQGYYFVGEALRRRGDWRCRYYFLKGLRHAPFKLRNYVRLLQSIGLMHGQSTDSTLPWPGA